MALVVLEAVLKQSRPCYYRCKIKQNNKVQQQDYEQFSLIKENDMQEASAVICLKAAKPVVLGMISRRNQKIPSEEATTVTSLDVLCGTSFQRLKHPGNRFFYLTVSKYIEQYVLAESKKDKMRVSKAALDELTVSGVRFLKKHRGHQHWYVASQKVGRDKIGSFLREHLPKAISGSDSDRRRQRPDGTVRPLPSLRPESTPLASFLLCESASSYGHLESVSSVWSKLDGLQDAFILGKVGRARTNQPAELPLSFQPPAYSSVNENTIGVRSSTHVSQKETLMPLFASSVSNMMETSRPLSLQKERPDNNNKKVQTYQRYRQETEAEEHKCVPIKYQSTSLVQLPSTGSFSSVFSYSEVIPRGVDLVSRFSWSSSMYDDDSSNSDLGGRNDSFGDLELADCFNW